MKEETIHNQHDKSYKSFLTQKESFIQFLQGFVHQSWAKEINQEQLELINKSFIPLDYEQRESDIIYKVQRGNKEFYFYILLELQSSNDFTMPFRLLIYMTELWKYIFMDATRKEERERKDYRLPAIIPMVLYNGKNNWTAKMSFKEMQQGYELFGENILDFKYILFDVNRYNDEELLQISNLLSAVFLLDKDMDKEKFLEQFKKTIHIIKNMSNDQWIKYKNWLLKILLPKIPKSIKVEVIKIIEETNNKEVDNMVMNLEITLDRIIEEGIEKGREEGIEEGREEGREKGKIEIAKKMIAMGLDINKVMEITELSRKTIEKIAKNK